MVQGSLPQPHPLLAFAPPFTFAHSLTSLLHNYLLLLLSLCRPLHFRAPRVSQTELLRVIYWHRQLSALLLGLFCALWPVPGFLGFAAFALLGTLAVYLHYTAVLGVDEDEYESFDLVAEGFTAALALFVVRPTSQITMLLNVISPITPLVIILLTLPLCNPCVICTITILLC